jgi:hypothetical protein
MSMTAAPRDETRAGAALPPAACRDEELLADVITRLIGEVRHIAVGNASPIPAMAALLARQRGRGMPYVSLLQSRKHNFFTDGGRELFDCAGQGRIDVFFLSGGEIDGEGNINLVAIGDYDKPQVRFPGSFGRRWCCFAPSIRAAPWCRGSPSSARPAAARRISIAPAARSRSSPIAACSGSIAKSGGSGCKASTPATPWTKSPTIPVSLMIARTTCRPRQRPAQRLSPCCGRTSRPSSPKSIRSLPRRCSVRRPRNDEDRPHISVNGCAVSPRAKAILESFETSYGPAKIGIDRTPVMRRNCVWPASM